MLDVAIIGAGLSGLTAAYHLQKKGYEVAVFECAGQVGGRCRTDYINGFILDRGIHFFQTAYPETKNLLDYKALKLESVYPGALIRHESSFHLLTNPMRKVGDLLSSVISPISNLKDKLKLAALVTQLATHSDKSIFTMEEQSTLEYLQNKGFSDSMIENFFLPFVKSVFFDDSMSVSNRLFCYTLKMFAIEDNTLPANGICSIPEQIHAKLKPGTVHLRTKVKSIQDDGLELMNGEFVGAKKIIVSTTPHDLAKILEGFEDHSEFNHVSCLYFACKTPPVKKPIIMLNGQGRGIVNNVFVPTTLQPAYAPAGSHLVMVTVDNSALELDDEELIDATLNELADWFGVRVNEWAHIKTHHIKYALPRKDSLEDMRFTKKIREDIFLCGDHLSFGSINSALRSGRETAEWVEKELRTISKENNKKASVY